MFFLLTFSLAWRIYKKKINRFNSPGEPKPALPGSKIKATPFKDRGGPGHQ